VDHIAVGDFDGDGRLDLALDAGSLYTLSGNGDGTLQAPVNQACVVGGPLAVADFNLDGRTDVASAATTFLGTATPPVPAIFGVLDAASDAAIVPGSWMTINGDGFAAASETWDQSIVNGKLPTLLDGVGVSMGGGAAIIQAVSPCQITAEAPILNSGLAAVTVSNANGTSAPVNLNVAVYDPAFYVSTAPFVLATHLDYTPVESPLEVTTPAKPGEAIILWGTGFGPTAPAAPLGVPVPADRIYAVANPIMVSIGGVAAPVLGAALTPGFAALYQIAIQIPAIADGICPVQAAMGGALSPDWYMLMVHQ